MLTLILLVLALVCFGLSVWQAQPLPLWNRLVSLGLTAYVLAQVLSSRL